MDKMKKVIICLVIIVCIIVASIFCLKMKNEKKNNPITDNSTAQTPSNSIESSLTGEALSIISCERMTKSNYLNIEIAPNVYDSLEKNLITSITIKNDGKEITETSKKADISVNQDGSVIAYFVDNANGYDMYIVGRDKIYLSDANHLFSGYESLKGINGLDLLDTSGVKDMSGMFQDCTSLSSVDLSNFDTSEVTNMSGMFSACGALDSIDLNSFKTSKVTDMGGMFYWCDSLQTINLSSFDTSNVTNMTRMFCNCTAIENIDLSNFETSKVTSMIQMFDNCSMLASLDLSSFNTSNANMEMFFDKCDSLEKCYVSNNEEANKMAELLKTNKNSVFIVK